MNQRLEEEIKSYIRKGGYDGLDSEQEVAQIARHFFNLALDYVTEKAIEFGTSAQYHSMFDLVDFIQQQEV